MNPKPNSIQPTHSQTVPYKFVAVVTLINGLFFSMTNPTDGGSLLLVLGICLFVVGVYAWAIVLAHILGAFWPLSLRTKRRVAIFLTVVVGALVILQSIGQLSWHDVLVIIPFAAALFAYVAYIAAPSNQ